VSVVDAPGSARAGAAAATGSARVVILGAGFAGLSACEALAAGADAAGLEIVIVDRHTYNTFQPLLYQVATAGLNPGDIAYPVRAFLRRHPSVSFRQGAVTGVDLARREVVFEGDGPPLAYDYLVIATGAMTNFFGVVGAREHSLAIYTMEDAIAVRDRVARSMERAATFGVSGGELTVVLVGGGPTGVEMAGTLAELRSLDLAMTYPGIRPDEARIVLVERQDHLLDGFQAKSASYALRALRRRGVEVRLSSAVMEVGPDHVVLEDGEKIACGTVVWSAGVTTGRLAERLDVAKVQGGRLEVTPALQLTGHPEVFVAGDVAGARREQGSSALVPQLAQPALQEGRHAARQLLRLRRGLPLEPFRYRDKGIMATIGRRAAVAELPGGLRLSGTPAWLAWLGLHLVFLLGFRNRVAVLLNWAWRYVWWRRGTRVIAGT
jgi:NADH dehydrogenase